MRTRAAPLSLVHLLAGAVALGCTDAPPTGPSPAAGAPLAGLDAALPVVVADAAAAGGAPADRGARAAPSSASVGPGVSTAVPVGPPIDLGTFGGC